MLLSFIAANWRNLLFPYFVDVACYISELQIFTRLFEYLRMTIMTMIGRITRKRSRDGSTIPCNRRQEFDLLPAGRVVARSHVCLCVCVFVFVCTCVVTAPHTGDFLGEGDRGRPSKVIHHFLSSRPISLLNLPKLCGYRYFCNV